MAEITASELRELDLYIWAWGPDKKKTAALRLFEEVKRLQYVLSLEQARATKLDDQLSDIEEEQITELLEKVDDLEKKLAESNKTIEALKAATPPNEELESLREQVKTLELRVSIKNNTKKK